MLKKTFITLLLILCTTVGFSQSDLVKIKSENLKEVNYLQADDFYLTHYLYIDLFLRENLFSDVTTEDVSAILDAIKKYVSKETPLEIEIEKPGDRNYLIRMAIFKKDADTELLIAFTNWSVKKRIFEKEIKMENDSYTRWYFLNDSKMTYRKDMSDKNDYSNMSKSDLANAYLFDELTTNDTKIKSTIDAAFKAENSSVTDTIMNHLMLLKYQIFKREKEEISKQVKLLDDLFVINKESTNLRGLEAAFNATKFQIELMK